MSPVWYRILPGLYPVHQNIEPLGDPPQSSRCFPCNRAATVLLLVQMVAIRSHVRHCLLLPPLQGHPQPKAAHMACMPLATCRTGSVDTGELTAGPAALSIVSGSVGFPQSPCSPLLFDICRCTFRSLHDNSNESLTVFPQSVNPWPLKQMGWSYVAARL